MYRNRKRISGCLGEGREGGAGRRDGKGTGRKFGVMKTVTVWIAVTASQVCTCIGTYRSERFKHVQFIVYSSLLNKNKETLLNGESIV